VQTYWLSFKAEDGSRTHSSSMTSQNNDTTVSGDDDETAVSMTASGMEALLPDSYEQFGRGSILNRDVLKLVDWNVELFTVLLKRIVAARKPAPAGLIPGAVPAIEPSISIAPGSMPSDESTLSIDFPDFDPDSAQRQRKSDAVELSEEVVSQLRGYIVAIAAM